MQKYILKQTMEFPGMVARIYSPVLTEEERKRRMKQIEASAASLLMAEERVEK